MKRQQEKEQELIKMKEELYEKDKVIGELNKSVETLKQKCDEITQLNQELKLDLLGVYRSSSKSNFIYTIDDFENKLRISKNGEPIFSNNFFCLDGYKARLIIYLNGEIDFNY